jgi:CO dehydrogenase maturation factor
VDTFNLYPRLIMVWDVLMVKIAVTGKGGVGKTTIAAGLARTFGSRGYRVIALDLDPSPNLASSLSCGPGAAAATPLVEMEDLILERTGAPPEGAGLVFLINPKVDDIPDRFGIPCGDGVRLLVLGSIRTGGGGCFCPANALARRLVDHLSGTADLLVMDMEAGVEHLGRGTTRTVEGLLVVAEPTVKSVEAAGQIVKLARDLGIIRIYGVVNKVREGGGEPFLSRLSSLGITLLGILPFDPAVQEAEEKGIPILDIPPGARFRAAMADFADTLERLAGPFRV